MNTAELYEQYRRFLIEGVIPFWMRHGVDAEFGGVLSCMGEDGTSISTEKYTWSQARFVWIPVALLGDKSLAQGAAILGAPDPVAAMEHNEASVQAKTGGISAMGVSDANKEAVKRNTQLLTAFGFGGVPTVVGKHAVTGELVTIDGALAGQPLAQRLGLNVPAS